MELFLIDAIGPFFRGYEKRRINWSKIPFPHLKTSGEEAETQWQTIHRDIRHFATEVSALGYNAVTLDDLAHLATHTLHEPEIAADIAYFRKQFTVIFDTLTKEFGLKVFLTSDILPLTPAISAALGDRPDELEAYYLSLVTGILDDFPQLSGLILRIGESDGNDVTDPIRTSLHLRNPAKRTASSAPCSPSSTHAGKNSSSAPGPSAPTTSAISSGTAAPWPRPSGTSPPRTSSSP